MRGDIYRIRTNRRAEGHEQRGARYAVVVQSDHLLLSTMLVAPTSTSANPTSFRPRISMDQTITYVLIDQVTAIDSTTRIGEFAGRLDARELAEVDRALAAVLGLR